jgi:hypothetical protein
MVYGALSTMTNEDYYLVPDGHLTARETIETVLEMLVTSLDGCPTEGSESVDTAILHHRLPSGSYSGAGTGGVWNDRTVNQYEPESVSLVALSGGDFQPIEGYYKVHVTAISTLAGRHRLRLYNVSDTVAMATGMNGEEGFHAFLDCYISTIGNDWFRIQHLIETNRSPDAFGRRNSDGSDETFLTVELMRLG